MSYADDEGLSAYGYEDFYDDEIDLRIDEWECRDGEVKKIKEMDRWHLEKCINFNKNKYSKNGDKNRVFYVLLMEIELLKREIGYLKQR